MEIYEYLTKNNKIPIEIFREYIEPMSRRKLPKEISILIFDQFEIKRLNKELIKAGRKPTVISIIRR